MVGLLAAASADRGGAGALLAPREDQQTCLVFSSMFIKFFFINYRAKLCKSKYSSEARVGGVLGFWYLAQPTSCLTVGEAALVTLSSSFNISLV